MKIRISRKAQRRLRVIKGILGWLLFGALGAAPYIILIAQLGK